MDQALEPAIRPRKVIVGSVVVMAVIAALVLILEGRHTGVSKTAHKARKPAAHSAGRGVFDSFRRADSASTLGVADNGSTWTAVSGAWGIQRNTAYVAAPAQARNVAFVDMGGKDGFVQVTASVVKPGAGLLLRYQNPSNYLALVAVPKYGTWNLQRVLNGKEDVIGNMGLAAIRDGTVISVRLDGPTAEVSIDNVRLKSFAVPDVRGATGAGLIAIGDQAGAARWRDFVGTPLTSPQTSSAPPGTQPPAAAKP